MRLTIAFSIVLVCLIPASLCAQTRSLTAYVDPLVGTAASTTASALKHGEGGEQRANTIPAVGMPFGMTQWTPQTRTTEEKCLPPYLYRDSLISGFRGTHWLSGSCVPDYGSFTLVPVVGRLRTGTAATALPFAHTDEVAGPDYYRVRFLQNHLTVEITATERCGFMQFTLNETDSLYLLVMPNSDRGKGFIKVDKTRGVIEGYNPAFRIYQGAGKPAGFSGYFVVELQKKTPAGGTFSGNAMYATDSLKEQPDIGAYLGLHLGKGESLLVRIGTSFTSIAAARKNLAAEIPAWNFNGTRQEAARKWNTALQRIEVTDENEKNKSIFYTALYHAMQQPRLFSDVDGTYPVFSKQYQLAKLETGRQYYDDFSMWDIYRAELPLLEILQPGLVNSLVQSIVLKGRQGGWLPVFPCWNSYTNAMVGDHATAFIASAYLKGIRGYDVKEAWRLMRQNAYDTPPEEAYKDGKGRRALPAYLRYGYIPLEEPVKDAFHRNEQVSRTLEYAYDDYALAMVARALGKTNDATDLFRRAGNYRLVFDTVTALVRGRHADGSWVAPFYPDQRTSYITEGTARQYTFYVPHDIPGLTRLMGGQHQLEAALDTLFSKGEYWHGNEPGHQTPFLYNFTAAPWKTQQAVRTILANEYSDGPGGLSGNDDAGQMSAWYLFAAMGFYPVNPVSDQYQLSSPLFRRASIRLPGNRRFDIITHRNSERDQYIRSVRLNGKPWQSHTIRYSDIMAGGKLEMVLGDQPAK